jgi:hypothetical protein
MRLTMFGGAVYDLRRDLAAAARGDAQAGAFAVNRYRNWQPRAGWAAWITAAEIAQIEGLIDEGRRR